MIETRIAKMWLNEDGILMHVINQDIEITLENMKEDLAARIKLCGKRKVLFLK